MPDAGPQESRRSVGVVGELQVAAVLAFARSRIVSVWWLALTAWYCTAGLAIAPHRMIRCGATQANRTAAMRCLVLLAAATGLVIPAPSAAAHIKWAPIGRRPLSDARAAALVKSTPEVRRRNATA